MLTFRFMQQLVFLNIEKFLAVLLQFSWYPEWAILKQFAKSYFWDNGYTHFWTNCFNIELIQCVCFHLLPVQDIKVFIIVIVFCWLSYYFFHYFFYCLIMAATYLTPCCYSSNGCSGCIPGCVTLATRLYLSVALGIYKYIPISEETAFSLFLGAYNGDIPVHLWKTSASTASSFISYIPMDMYCIIFPWNHRWKWNMLFIELYVMSIYDEYLLLPVYDR